MQSTQHRNNTIPHLLYTGDLQLIGEKQLQAVRTCSDDIHMENGTWQMCKDCAEEMKISSLTEFNTWLQQRNVFEQGKHTST